MNSFRGIAVPWLAAVLAFVPAARAQQNAPHLGYVYPAGGRQGSTFQVKVGGQFLAGVTAVYVFGGSVQATVIEHNKPLTPREINALREKLQGSQKKGRDAAALKEIAGIREQIAATLRRNANPVISETVTLQVTADREAEPGKREFRLATPRGLSNPLVFCVGQLPEFSEARPKIGNPLQGRTEDGEMIITLPATVNGQIIPGDGDLSRLRARPGQQFLPGDADGYRFRARQGQQLVVAVSARELIPYLADAVPGWFQAAVALYDAAGNEVAYDDDYRFHPDPVLHYEIPRDGDYVIEIKDAIYRGREDFVYRLTLGELPFVTGIYPLGGRAGVSTPVEIKGWNLLVDSLTMDAGDRGPGIYPLWVRSGELVSNRMPFAVDTLPEGFAKEPNNSQESAQRITLPITLNGRIDQPGDWDVFSFTGRAGDEIVAEVLGRRLDSPLDSLLRLTDAAGRQLAFNDDHEDKGAGLYTHHADSLIAATLPANGTYYLYLGDAQQKGGAEYAYRLRVSAPRPDFDLRVAPSAINVLVGANVPITVYALRRDGFSGDIALTLKDAPRGYTLSGGLVPAGRDKVRLTLTVPPRPQREPLSISLVGHAMIQGREVVRPAAPADDMMQAFAYRHLVPAEDLRVMATGRGAAQAPRILGAQPVIIPAGGTARIRVAMPTIRLFEKVQFELSEPPDGISVREVLPGRQGAEIVLQCDGEKAKPGLKGNLIVNVSGERAPPPGNEKAQAARRRIPLGTLPAIPFEIGKGTVGEAHVSIKP